jgi:hypothetical protein
MLLLHGLLPPRFGRSHPLALSDLAWRSLVGLAATVDPPLAALRRRDRLDAAEVHALVTAVVVAMPALPHRSVAAWLDGMMRARAAGRAPAPADYWSTMEPQLRDVLAWLQGDGAMGCRVGRHLAAAPTDDPTATPAAPALERRPDGRAPDRATQQAGETLA